MTVMCIQPRELLLGVMRLSQVKRDNKKERQETERIDSEIEVQVNKEEDRQVSYRGGHLKFKINKTKS